MLPAVFAGAMYAAYEGEVGVTYRQLLSGINTPSSDWFSKGWKYVDGRYRDLFSRGLVFWFQEDESRELFKVRDGVDKSLTRDGTAEACIHAGRHLPQPHWVVDWAGAKDEEGLRKVVKCEPCQRFQSSRSSELVHFYGTTQSSGGNGRFH